MDLTIQIITRNNRDVIRNTIESAKSITNKILIGDISSQDGTPELCKKLGCSVINFEPKTAQDYARNKLIQLSDTEWQMWLNPWEIVVQGQQHIGKNDQQIVSIFQENTLTKETRVWNKSSRLKFKNPIYETLGIVGQNSPITIYSSSKYDYEYNLHMTEEWKSRCPTIPEPYYYYALTLLSQGKYDLFLNASEHYMFLEQKPTKSNIINRYYYSLIQIYHKKNIKPALQNINICISVQPLMAEFWCLIGDIYYHMYNKFTTAKDFYQNAIFLGSHRMNNDNYPMDISKYKEYPEKMINSCDEIMSQNLSFFKQVK